MFVRDARRRIRKLAQSNTGTPSGLFNANLLWLTATLAMAWPRRAGSAQGTALLLLSSLEGAMIVGRTLLVNDAPMQAAKALFDQLDC